MADEQYIDLITGKPLEPWAKQAMDRKPAERSTDREAYDAAKIAYDALRPVGAENVRERALDGLVVEWRDRALKAVEKLGEAKGLLSVIADVADIVNAHIDEATYTDRRKLGDWPGDHEFDLSIPWYMVRDLNDVICKIQRWLKEVALITPTAGNGEAQG